MNNNPKFAVQLLEKIGSPLAVAINNVTSGGDGADIESATIMAQLLGQVTQISTKLYNMLEIKEEEQQSDSTRLALAALSCPLVVNCYIKRKQIPMEEDITQIGKSLEAVISFGENFSPAADHKSRLQTIDHDVVFFDKDQPSLVILQSMVPVINAVEEFPFGQGKRKLVQDIAVKLEAVSGDIAKRSGNSDKLKELIIFKALAELYTSCHLAETQRASSGDAASHGELSIDSVWEIFAIRVAMVEALMGIEIESGDSKAPNPEQSKVEKPEDKPQEKPQEQVAPSGPMGFFKKDESNKSSDTATAEVNDAAPSEKTSTPPTEVEDLSLIHI